MRQLQEFAPRPEKIYNWLNQTYKVPKSFVGWQNWPLYVLLLAIYPVLFLYAFNIQEVTLDMLWLPLAVTTSIAGLLIISSKAILRTWSRAALWSAVSLVVIFTFGRVLPLLPDMLVKFGEFVLGKNSLAMLFAILLLIVFTAWMRRHKNFDPRRANIMINGLVAVLVMFSLFEIIPVEAGRFAAFSDDSVEVVADTIELPEADKPDVYYIVFDRYGGNKTLKEFYGFDNSTFHEMLKDKGFYVAEDSMANYPATAFSLSSSLNMRYHEGLNPDISTEATDIYPLLKNPEVAREFKIYGYKFIQLGSWFWQTAQDKGLADETYSYSRQEKQQQQHVNQILGMDAFSSKLLSTTIAFPIVERFWPTILVLEHHDSHYWHIEYQRDKLKDIVTQSDSPKFVFIHLLVPHEPFVYDETCNYISEELAASNTLVQNYLNMVQCANAIAENMIEEIRLYSDHDPAIIIQGDEGPYPIKDWGEPIQAMESKTTDQLLERFRIQNAYYFPNKDYSQLYQTITPVNSFKVLFNNIFKQNNQLLPDENYRFPDAGRLFEHFKVTDQLRNSQ